jgi:hypothetical protein
MIHKLKEFKESILITSHLEIVLNIIRLAYAGLYPFKMYLPVKRLLFALEAEKAILDAHYAKYKKIKETKGQIQ